MSNASPRAYPTPRRIDFNAVQRTPLHDYNPTLNISTRSGTLSKSTSDAIELIIAAADEAAIAAQAAAKAFTSLVHVAEDAITLHGHVGGTRKRSKKSHKRTRKN